jgi:hypothetical protein
LFRTDLDSTNAVKLAQVTICPIDGRGRKCPVFEASLDWKPDYHGQQKMGSSVSRDTTGLFEGLSLLAMPQRNSSAAYCGGGHHIPREGRSSTDVARGEASQHLRDMARVQTICWTY